MAFFELPWVRGRPARTFATDSSNDSVVIEDWYNGAGNTLDFGLSDGRRLDETDVQQLVRPMSTMVEPGFGATEWTDDQQLTLDPIVDIRL